MSDLDDLARAAGNLPAPIPQPQQQRVTRRLRTEPEYMVHDRGREWGPYSEAELTDYIAECRFSPGAHGRHVSGLEWFRLSVPSADPYAPPPTAYEQPAAIQQTAPVYVNVVTNVVNPSRHAPRRRQQSSTTTQTGAALLLAGIVLSCIFFPLGLGLMSVGFIVILVGLMLD